MKFSITPLTEPAEIFRQMPAQALSPALLQMLELLSSPILLIENRPAGELIEMPQRGYGAPARARRASARPSRSLRRVRRVRRAA